MTLYNLHTDGDQYRITKFVDGDIKSSYLCTEQECTCPAGTRPSCRHRQMLPDILARDLCDTHYFWDFDRRQAVDFNGSPKHLIDNLNQLAAEQDTLPVPEGEHVEGATSVQGVGVSKSWRRI